jgi:hypothetical protein
MLQLMKGSGQYLLYFSKFIRPKEEGKPVVVF